MIFFAQNIIIFLAAFRPVKCLVITCWSFAIKTHLNAAVNTQLIVSCQLHAFKANFFSDTSQFLFDFTIMAGDTVIVTDLK